MSDHRKNIIKKLGLPQWVANAVHEICPSKESFLLARYVRDIAVQKGYCSISSDSVSKGFYSDFSLQFKMPCRKDIFSLDNFEEIKDDLIKMKDNFKK